jgi:hypothetical protein
MSYIVSKLMLKICCRVCLQSVIWYFRGSVLCPRVPHRSPGSTLSCVRRFAFRSRPGGARPPTAAGRAWCWANSSPTRRCEDAPVIALFRPRELRGSQVEVLRPIPDGSESQLQRQDEGKFELQDERKLKKFQAFVSSCGRKQFALKSLQNDKND